MEKVLNDKLHFAKLTSNASSPSKGSTESAGLDLYRFLLNFLIYFPLFLKLKKK